MPGRSDGGVDATDRRLGDERSVRDLGNGRFVVGTGNARASAPGDGTDDGAPRYVFDVVATVDGRRETARFAGDDVAVVTGRLFEWAATVVAPAEDPRESLGLLLVGGDRPLRLPVPAVRQAVSAYGLAPTDPVGDLLAAADTGGSFQIPTRR